MVDIFLPFCFFLLGLNWYTIDILLETFDSEVFLDEQEMFVAKVALEVSSLILYFFFCIYNLG